MDRWSNEPIEGIHPSRFVASFINAGGSIKGIRLEQWLKTLTINGRKLDEDEISRIKNFTCGKLELESYAKKWLKEQ